MLRTTFLFCLLSGLASAVLNCYSCATIGLRDNWQITGYPIQPAGMIYDDRCNDAPESILPKDTVTVDCTTTKTCVDMVIPTGVNTYEVLRGCHGILTGATQNYSQTVTGVTPGDTGIRCTLMPIDGRGTNGIRYCEAPEGDATSCNGKLQADGAGSLVNINHCDTAPTVDCVQCSYFDGKGKKCKKTEDGSGKSAICTWTTGKMNGRDYQESAPAYLLPTDNHNFCKQVLVNQTVNVDSGFGTSVTRTKRSVNQVIEGVTCYCDTAGCNSSPTVLATSMTLLVVLTVLPFFC